jgi:hypothetical protein
MMFISRSMRKNIIVRASSVMLLGGALLLTLGEAIQIMILFLGNNESNSRRFAFGYALPLVSAGVFLGIALLAWGWCFACDCFAFALPLVAVLAKLSADINWKWLDNVNMQHKGFWGTSICLQIEPGMHSRPSVYSDSSTYSGH